MVFDLIGGQAFKFEPSESITYILRSLKKFLDQVDPTNAILDPSGDKRGEYSVPSRDVSSVNSNEFISTEYRFECPLAYSASGL